MYEGLDSKARAESIHVLVFPKYNPLHENQGLLAEWEKLRGVRETVLKALEEVRQAGVIGNPVEHSLSPAIHNAAFQKLGLNFVYLAWQVEAIGDAKTRVSIDVNIQPQSLRAKLQGPLPRLRTKQQLNDWREQAQQYFSQKKK